MTAAVRGRPATRLIQENPASLATGSYPEAKGFGNVSMGRTFVAFRDAVRSLYNFADFEAEVLSSGFQGVVYKVTDKRTRQVMVLKKNKEKENRKRSLQEIQILNKLDHPNIVRYVGACVWEGQLHLLTEFVNGGSMEHLLKNKMIEITWRTKMKFARDIALGMAYLHSKKFYHRDLASKNCLLRKSDDGMCTVVVADFGLAGEIPDNFNWDKDETDGGDKRKSETPPMRRKRISVVSQKNGTKEIRIDLPSPTEVPLTREETKSRSGSMKRAQSIVGTTYWMAPEVLHGKIYSEKVDVFSYSIVLCEIIARVDADPDILKRTNDFGLDRDAFRELCKDLDCPNQFMNLAFQCSDINPQKRPPFSQIGPYLNSLLYQSPPTPVSRPKSLFTSNEDDKERHPSFLSQLRVQLRSPSPPECNEPDHPGLHKRHSLADLSQHLHTAGVTAAAAAAAAAMKVTTRASSSSPRSLRRSITSLKITKKVKTRLPSFKSYLDCT